MGRISDLPSTMYVTLFFVGPLQRGPFTHRNGGDPVLLNAFFFLYLAASGGGAWSVDRLLGRESSDDRWAHAALGVMRIVAGCLFVMHGLEKLFGVGGGPVDRDIMTMRGLAGYLEIIGGPRGLFTRPVAFILFCFLFLFLCAAGSGAWSLGDLLRRRARDGARVGLAHEGGPT